MLHVIEGLPPDILGISASGTVAPKEYQEILIPAVEQAASHPRAQKLLFVAGPSFKGFAARTAWSYSLPHAGVFSRIALVTNLAWLRAAAAVCAPVLSGDMAMFAPADLPAALHWLSGGGGGKHRNFIEREILTPSFTDIGEVVDAEDARHDGNIARREQRLRRKLRKAALSIQRENRSSGRTA